LEENCFLAWTFAVPKCAYRLGGFVFKTREHFVEVWGAEGEHEPFAGRIRVLDERLWWGK
jgi:hypothetical protein